MKILMLNYEFPPIGGGAGQAHENILRQYAQVEDLQVDVLTSGLERGYSFDRFSANINIYKVGIHKKDLHYWRKVEVVEWLIKANRHYSQLIEENNYDLAHAFFAFPTGWLCYRTVEKLPYIVSLRGSDVPGLHPRLSLDYKILAPVFRKIWRKATAIVACSQGLRNRALRFMPSVKIDVIPNGVDLQRFSSAGQKEQTKVFRLLTVGRLSATKRIDLLIEAVSILGRKNPDIKLTIAGGGSLKETICRIVERHKLQSVVTVEGMVASEKMPELYQRHDIFVLATAQEGMSNAMLEATACGLPIVTTRCEGVEELISDNGIVIEQPSPQAFAHAIEKLSNNHEVCRRMSTAAQNQAKKFTWQSVSMKYIDCYRKHINS